MGKKQYSRSFFGRLIGRIALNNMLSKDQPLQKNAPTRSEFKIQESEGDVAAEKMKWITLIEEYAQYPEKDFTHWFFGKMSREQVGYFVYKHTDHHLRQFNQ